MKLAIMQPYFFPYIGYMQLVNIADVFVFYDDVNYIKNGWINRNRLIVQNQANYFTIQLSNASSFLPINEVKFTDNRKKIEKTIEQSYKKHPYFNDVFPVIKNVLSYETESISELAIESIQQISDYLELNVIFKKSSEQYPQTKGLDRIDRICEICKLNSTNTYINSIGGYELYSKEIFDEKGIHIFFLKTSSIQYPQKAANTFHPNLSIIDVLMNCGKTRTQELLTQYELL